jgi:hypothetical protein
MTQMKLHDELHYWANMTFRGRVSPRQARYFSLLRQSKVPKRKATLLPMSLRCASGKLGARSQGGAAKLVARHGRFTRTTAASQMTKQLCPAAQLPAPGSARQAMGRRGEIREPKTCFAWAVPLANFISKPSTPDASSCCWRCGYSPSIHACDAQHTGPHGRRRTAMLCRLTCRGCSSGALQAQSEFRGRPCVLGDAGCPGAIAPGSGIAGAHFWPTLLGPAIRGEQQGRSPAGANSRPRNITSQQCLR